MTRKRRSFFSLPRAPYFLGLRTNSLPRSVRTLPHQTSLRPGLSTLATSLIDEDDGALSAPEMPSVRRDRGKNMMCSHCLHDHSGIYTEKKIYPQIHLFLICEINY